MKKKIINSIIGLSIAGAFVTCLASCDNNQQGNTTNIPNTNSTPSTNTDPTVSTTTGEGKQEETKYTIEFDSNRGSSVASAEVAENSLVNKPADPVRDDLEFEGWYLGDSLYDFNTPVTSDITLKAKWKGANVNLGGIGFNSESVHEEMFGFKDSYLEGDSSVFNKNLAIYLYGASVANDGSSSVADFFKNSGFDNATTYPTTEQSFDDISYTIATKKAKDVTYIVASVRGMGYTTEWASNFDIGTEGNHQGFSVAAGHVVEDLNKVLNSTEGNIKLALTGYSRGGAVANLVADTLISLENKKIENKDIYAYTYEAPKGILKGDRDIAYNNVFNIINEADLVTAVAPEQYGFFRCGKDINIYKADVDSILAAYDEKLVLPEFAKVGGVFESDETIKNLLLNYLISHDNSDAPEKMLATREQYTNNYSPTLQFVFSKIVFGLKAETKDALIADLTADKDSVATKVLGLITDANKLYNYLKPFLDEDEIEYNDDEFKAACNKTVDFLTGPASALVLSLVAQEGRNDLLRSVSMHFPVVNYVLLKNYNPSK